MNPSSSWISPFGFFSWTGYSLRFTTRMNLERSARLYSRRTVPLPGCPSTVPSQRPISGATGANGSGAADCPLAETALTRDTGVMQQ